MDENELKIQLCTIRDNDYACPANFDSLVDAMLTHIGSTDAELRDHLIYPTFSRWILRRRLFSAAQLKQLLSIALDDRHLFYRLGEKNTDSVFTRSFSVLLFPLILIFDREQPFLTKEEIVHTKEKLLSYLHQEQDLRGYIPVKGWAHAVAHAGDALDDLAQCRDLGSADLLEILSPIAEKMGSDEMPYIYEEDERMTTAVVSVIDRRLVSDAEIASWIRDFAAGEQGTKWSPASFRRVNRKNFLRCLYFRLYDDEKNGEIIRALQEAIAILRP